MNEPHRTLGPDVLARLTLDTEPWLSCDQCFDDIDLYVELLVRHREAQMPAMAVHLRACPACAEEAETLSVLAAEDAGVDPDEVLARLG
jgi:hypothetical protein